ncbi:MAG: GAF domain-containing sensor histidine kinase [Saprospiraceae bacterium]|nr:GAF domain-containing sensor histidine kinase [Saprospiraceae bacterium]
MNLHQLQARNQELSILNAIAQDLNRALTLEKALATALRQTVHLLQLKTGWIWLIAPDDGSSYIAASYNLPPIFEERTDLLTGTCYCLEKYINDNLSDTANISEITCSRLKDLEQGTDRLRFHASVPLLSNVGKIGIMNVLSEHSQELSDSQLQMLHTIGDMLSIAIERARLFEKSQQLGVIEERNRLAREIHDTLAQGLSGIALKLETTQALLENDKRDKANQWLTQTLEFTRQNLEEARRSVLDLRATPLQGHNLIEALRSLVEEVAEDLEGKLEVSGTHHPLEQRAELGLYRIAQEALTNIRKHAECQAFQLRLDYKVDQLLLIIADAGRGFNIEEKSSGFGLIGIRERVHLLKGSMTLHSTPDSGTRLEVSVPYNSNA